jgi:hypothetical protein
MSDIVTSTSETPILNVTVNSSSLANVQVTSVPGTVGYPPENQTLNVLVNGGGIPQINVLPAGGGPPGPMGPTGERGATGPLPSEYISSINTATGVYSIKASTGLEGIEIIGETGGSITLRNTGVRTLTSGPGILLTGTPQDRIVSNFGLLGLRGGGGIVTSSRYANLAGGTLITITNSGDTFTISANSAIQGATGPRGSTGATGPTGSININEPLFDTNTGITKNSSFTNGTQGLARKVVVLAENGSLTFDFIRNFDIFNPSDFTFSILSFTTTSPTTSLIGNLTSSFNLDSYSIALSYGSIYPATGLTLSIGGSGFGFPINPSSPYNSYNFTNLQGISYNGVPQSTIMTATATDGNITSTSTITFNFYNNVYYGVSTNTGLTGDGINNNLTSIVSNTKTRTFNVSPSVGEYIYYAYPVRLGSSAIFTVGSFSGGFENAYTSGVTNNNNYYEDFYIFRSTNANLGSVSITVS